jgi:glycosyltransferase involved in cell wall biosynthesis
MHYLAEEGVPHHLVHSFSRAWWMVPAAGMRRIIEPFNRAASVRWHVVTHGASLRVQLRRLLQDGSPAVVYAQCPLSAAAALSARANASQRVILAVHFNVSQATEWVMRGLISQGDPIWRHLVATEQDVIPKLDGLVFVSEFMREELSKRIPEVHRVSSQIIPNFVRTPPIPTAVPPPDYETDLVCVGSLEPRKNQAYLLDILSAAQSRGLPLSLTFIGDGACKADLMARAAASGIAPQVRFAGFVRDANRVLPRYRALVQVARLENLPIVLIEAMSQGVPFFATPVGGTPELFEDGKEGWAIPLDDADTAASIITKVLRDKDLLARASVAARQRFATKYDASIVALRLRRFLTDDARRD